jgi:hypothetical protein
MVAAPAKPGKRNCKDIRLAMELVMASVAGRVPAVCAYSFSGNGSRPVAKYVFKTEVDCVTAKVNGLASDIETLTWHALVAGGHPPKVAEKVMVIFASREGAGEPSAASAADKKGRAFARPRCR